MRTHWAQPPRLRKKDEVVMRKLYSYIVIRAESEDNLRVHISGPYPAIQQIGHCPVGGCQCMHGGQYLEKNQPWCWAT
jgi:hypothetical protein